MELSKLLEKLSEKYPDDQDVLLAKDEFAKMESEDMEPEGEELPEDDLSLGGILDLEPGEESPEEAPEFGSLLEEDMGEEDEDAELMSKKKKKPLV